MLAVATVFLTLQGTAVVDANLRRRVDPHWQRGMSYLKLGWKWVKQCLSKGYRLFHYPSFVTVIDPQPALASLQRFQTNQVAREFIVRSPRILTT